MSIVDVTNKLLPVQIAKVEYPDTAYAHQGWLTEDQRYFMMGDELDEGDTAGRTRTLVFDVADLDNASFVGANEGETPAIDHNMYVKDGLVFQSNYAAGLRVLDTSDVANANLPQVAFFDGFPANDDPEFVGTWSNYPYFPSGTIAFSGIDEGLFI
jgi:choice-of-anchor B domain-containing protein